MIEIQKVKSGRDLNKFLKLPMQLYQNEPNWVAPLLAEEKKLFNPKKNSFFNHAEVEHFLAVQDNRLVGRVSAIINHRHNEFHNEDVVFFGFLDFIDDKNVSRLLLQRVEAFGREKGMTIARGPMNFSTNDSCGMLLEGFDDDPVIMMPYNFPYYNDHLQEHGYRKAMDLYSYLVDARKGTPDRVKRIGQAIEKRGGYTIRYVWKNKIDELLPDIRTIYNKAWEKNWGFVPVTEVEFYEAAESMKSVMEPKLVFVVYNQDDEPIGFSLSLPDANQAMKRANGKLFPFGIFKIMKDWKKINRLRNLIMGVIPEYRQKGVEAMMIYYTYKNAVEKEYLWADLGWILENNEMMTKELENIGSHVYKKFRVYEREL
jgi:GNAT superfamily N-acetyltransferase